MLSYVCISVLIAAVYMYMQCFSCRCWHAGLLPWPTITVARNSRSYSFGNPAVYATLLTADETFLAFSRSCVSGGTVVVTADRASDLLMTQHFERLRKENEHHGHVSKATYEWLRK
ncbi:hypothetical protein NPIL_290131 [Nephila pilipes]|uniref:Uncharacterized protein n=1 Tax=Nephila pilipes TaxID=299642 RepID=A0A8X6UT09_NEPPI|nr:hypothetical protein NPIL_290131 [Nephila pilipes]